MADKYNHSDTESHEFEDQDNVSLVPETKTVFPCFPLNRKTAIFGVVGAGIVLLLVVVVLLAVFLRSSPESVKHKQEKAQEMKPQVEKLLRLPRHLSPIEYHVYLHPNLTTFTFSGKVEVLLYCNEVSTNVTLHAGKKINYIEVQVAFIPDSNHTEIKQALQAKNISRLEVDMVWIELDSELQRDHYYFLVIEFDSELSKRLAGFYVSKYTSPSKKKVSDVFFLQ